VKSQRKRAKKKKSVVHNASLELDEFVRIEYGHNSFDLWIKLSILNGRPISTSKHRMFNKYVNAGWKLSKSCRLRKTDKGLFLDVFFEKEAEPVKGERYRRVGFGKLATLSNGQMVGKELKSEIMKFYKRKHSHLIIKEFINRELKKIDFSKIRTLVVERLKDVKKNKRDTYASR